MAIKSILVVDDSPTDRKQLSDMLTKSGYKVATAESAEEALAKVKQINPDLVLMDVVMPGQNGYQATRQLTKDDSTKHIPVIMLSSKDGVFDRARGRLAGSDQYLTKPFTREGLIEVVNQYVGAKPASTTS